MSFPFYSLITTSGSSNQRNRRKSSDKEQRSPVFPYAKQNGSVDRFRVSGSQGSPHANRSADRDSTSSAIRRKIPFLGRRRKSIAVLRPTEEPPMYDKRQTFLPLSDSPRHAKPSSRGSSNAYNTTRGSPPRSKTPELPPLNMSSLTLGSLTNHNTPIKNQPYNQMAMNGSPSRRANAEQSVTSRPSNRHPLSAITINEMRHAPHNTETKTRSTFLSRVAPALTMRRSSADIKASAASAAAHRGSRPPHTQTKAQSHVYTVPPKEPSVPSSNKTTPTITVTVPSQQSMTDEKDLFMTPRTAPAPPGEDYSPSKNRHPPSAFENHQSALTMPQKRDTRDNLTTNKAHRRYAIQVAPPADAFSNKYDIPENVALPTQPNERTPEKKTHQSPERSPRRVEGHNTATEDSKTAHRQTLRSPTMVRIGRSEVTLSVANELQTGLGIDVAESDTEESSYSQEQAPEVPAPSLSVFIHNRARSATLPESINKGFRDSTANTNSRPSVAFAENVERNDTKSWRQSLNRLSAAAQPNIAPANKLRRAPSKTSMGFLSRSVSNLNLKSASKPVNAATLSAATTPAKAEHKVKDSTAHASMKMMPTSTSSTNLSAGNMPMSMTTIPSLTNMPTIPSTSSSISDSAHSTVYTGSSTKSISSGASYASTRNAATQDSRRGDFPASNSSKRPIYLPPPPPAAPPPLPPTPAKESTKNTPPRASPSSSPSKKYSQKAQGNPAQEYTYDELLSNVRSQTARFDQLAAYLLKVIQRHQNEKSNYDSRIYALEEELHRREREIKGLRWLVTNVSTSANNTNGRLTDGAERIASLQAYLASPEFSDHDETPRPLNFDEVSIAMTQDSHRADTKAGTLTHEEKMSERSAVRKGMPRLSRSITMPDLRNSALTGSSANDGFSGLGLDFPIPGPLSLPSIASTMISSGSSAGVSVPGLTNADTLSSDLSIAGQNAPRTVATSQSLPNYIQQRPEPRSLYNAPRPPPSAHVPDEVYAASLAYARNLNTGTSPSIEQVITKAMERESVDLDEMFDEMIQGIQSTSDMANSNSGNERER